MDSRSRLDAALNRYRVTLCVVELKSSADIGRFLDEVARP
jgi:hypothetical protein